MRTYFIALPCLLFILLSNTTKASALPGINFDKLGKWSKQIQYYQYGNNSNNHSGNNHGHHDDNDDNGDDNGSDDDNSNDIPLDGGLSFLAIAGTGLGIKKIRDSRAKNKNKGK